MLSGTGAQGAADPQAPQLAAAALLIGVAQADHMLDTREREAMHGALVRAFGLAPAQVAQLLELAQAEAASATSDHGYTRLVNQRFSEAQKAELICDLWRVAHADGDVHKYEEHLIRRIAELLYLPHSEFIRAKLRAAAEAGSKGGS